MEADIYVSFLFSTIDERKIGKLLDKEEVKTRIEYCRTNNVPPETVDEKNRDAFNEFRRKVLSQQSTPFYVIKK